MPMLETVVRCPECGTLNEVKEVVTSINEQTTIFIRQVMWCKECRTELRLRR